MGRLSARSFDQLTSPATCSISTCSTRAPAARTRGPSGRGHFTAFRRAARFVENPCGRSWIARDQPRRAQRRSL